MRPESAVRHVGSGRHVRLGRGQRAAAQRRHRAASSAGGGCATGRRPLQVQHRRQASAAVCGRVPMRRDRNRNLRL